MSLRVGENTSRIPFLFGADPEVFLKNKAGGYVSAIGKFAGTKDRPIPVRELGKGFAKQVDNVLVEYNIPAVSRMEKWVEAHTKMLTHLRKEAENKGLSISIDASAELPDDELQDPMSRVFGCEPDFDAWNLCVNNAPRSNNPNLRSAGGHIHIGARLNDVQKINLVRFLDLLIGSWSVFADPDTRRKELYGRPGAMRFKPYGIEYRTVSNFWLISEDFMKIAYGMAAHAIRKGPVFQSEKYLEPVKSMFANQDHGMARQILLDLGITDVAKFARTGW